MGLSHHPASSGDKCGRLKYHYIWEKKTSKETNSNSPVQSLKQIPCSRVVVSKNVSVKISKITDFSKILIELQFRLL